MNAFSIVFTVVIVILLFMLLRYIFSDPNTLQNMQDGTTASTINASSLATNGSSVPSSNFAYSIWFYVNNWNYRYGEPKVIFGRMGAMTGDGSGDVPGVSGANPCPAVVLGAVENNVSVSLSCYPGADQEPATTSSTGAVSATNTVVHTCSVTNVPIQKWTNLVMSVYGRTMDLYLDGKLVRTCLLPGVASVNNSANVYVTPKGGFEGWTAKFQYFPNSLNPQDVWNVYSKGYTNWTNVFNTYQLQISLVENGNTQTSVTV